MMNDSYLFLWLDIDPSASSRESPLSLSLPFGGDFPGHQTKVKNKTMQREKSSTGTEKTHTCRHADELCHTPPSLSYCTNGNVSTSQEMFANVRTCGYRGPRPHVHSVQLCWGPPANRVPPSASTPSRETNCEHYWLPRQICAVQRVNKMDGVVRLSSGKVFWQQASGRVQHSPG